jgi:hypothetical protein
MLSSRYYDNLHRYGNGVRQEQQHYSRGLYERWSGAAGQLILPAAPAAPAVKYPKCGWKYTVQNRVSIAEDDIKQAP